MQHRWMENEGKIVPLILFAIFATIGLTVCFYWPFFLIPFK